MSESYIRLLQDLPLDGPTNMARDEALMQCVGQGESPPTLRLYQWDSPTISLGYFQKYEEYQALPSPAGELAVVRRLTGGGAILHDLELTYSLMLPLNHPLLEKGPNRLYELAHDAVIAALSSSHVHVNRCGSTDDSSARHGPFFCFSRRHCYDVLMGQDKIAGSAQRRTKQAVLQHGSIILANRFDQQATAALENPFEESLAAIQKLLPETFSNVLNMKIEAGQWSEKELETAATLHEKYAGDEWTRKM